MNMLLVRLEGESGKVGSFYGLPDENGCLPYFRCPSFDEAFELTDWMTLLLDTINTKLNSKSNLIKKIIFLTFRLFSSTILIIIYED